jgi:alanine-synthesizing transaminase
MRFARRTNWDLTLNPLAAALAAHRAAGKPLIDLTVSNPTECGFTYDTEAILGALRNAKAMKYEPHPKGLEIARRAVAGYYADRGDQVSIEDIFLTTSTSEAYSWVMRLLCDPGDEVLIPSPGYPLLDFLADLNDVHLVRYPLFYDHGWHYDLHALEQAITPRTKAVVVVHPNNPTGNYCKPQERERLNRICAEHGLAIIADEVFLDYALDGVPRDSFVSNGGGASVRIAESAQEAGAGENPGNEPDVNHGSHAPLTFTLSGISKICGLPQMKVAWVAISGPEEEKRQATDRLEVIADTYLSMNAPVQLALPALLTTRHSFQAQLLTRVRYNLTELDRLLASRPNWNRAEVEGGWCVVLSGLASSLSGDASAGELLAKGALAHPGDFYGFARSGHLVVSLLSQSSEFCGALTVLVPAQV